MNKGTYRDGRKKILCLKECYRKVSAIASLISLLLGPVFFQDLMALDPPGDSLVIVEEQLEVLNELRERFRDHAPIQVNYMAYREAKWEEDFLREDVNERRNEGGLVYVYLTNTTSEPQYLRHWMINGYEDGYYKIAGKVVWDRWSDRNIQPGATEVVEICAVSSEFGPGGKAIFTTIGRNWEPNSLFEDTFFEEEARISSIVFDSLLKKVTFHLINSGNTVLHLENVELPGIEVKEFSFTSNRLDPKGHVIGFAELKHPVSKGDMTIVKINTSSGSIYSHRRAFPDLFPIGTWGLNENQLTEARQHHIDVFVKGGRADDPFYSDKSKWHGFRTMVHTGLIPNIEVIRDMEDHPALACWMIQDEPDWTTPPHNVFSANESTRQYSSQIPSMITLCRNVRFFEYAAIPDIPCQDHYSVTAPTSSIWPYDYGTRLEETGYYTADLKRASEPKPVWVWSQGVHLWDERPKHPLPSPDELGAQLFFNLGKGAKGILWFTFQEKAGSLYPKTKKALQEYGRLLTCTRQDILVSEPYQTSMNHDEKIDVAPLLSENLMMVFLTNTDYDISDSV